eukprot:5712686-Pyramimonas_sp.AAC.1
MMAAGKSVTDLFHPLCLMDRGAYKFWSYSVHIVSDSTTSFRDASKKNKPSLLPEYHLREQVQGISQNIMGGCMAPGL